MSDNVDDLLFAMGRPMLLTNGEVRILLDRAGLALRETRDDRDRLESIVTAAMEALGDEAPAEPSFLGDYLIGLVAEWEALHSALKARGLKSETT